MLAHHLTEAQIRAVAAYSGMTTCSPPRPDKAIVLRQIEARRGETIQEGDGIDYLKKTGQRIMTKSGGISRRQILTIAGAAGVSLTGAAAVIGTSTSAQAAKVSQKLVKYQDTPKGEQRCDNCELFEAPSSCKNVDGTIAAQGWCTVYRKKPA